MTFTLDDGGGTAHGGHNTDYFNATVDVAGPLILTDSLRLVEEGELTIIYGLSVSDASAPSTETFTVSAITAGAEFGQHVTVTSPAYPGHLGDLNTALDDGVTYVSGPSPTDMVTLTVADSLGASDTVNFIFNLTGPGPVALQGTALKDVIFATGDATRSREALATTSSCSGLIAATTPSPTSSRVMTGSIWWMICRSLQAIRVRSTPGLFPQAMSCSKVRTRSSCSATNSIRLSNVSRASLHMNDFILHPQRLGRLQHPRNFHPLDLGQHRLEVPGAEMILALGQREGMHAKRVMARKGAAHQVGHR